MKAAAFDYIRPDSTDAVIEALADAGDEARIIAGGQTLVPLMAMRLVRPSLLIDINHIAGLAGVTATDHTVSVMACTRQADAQKADAVTGQLPLLAKALAHVGHTQTRNRGTIGGSIVNADPSAEVPIIARTLDAVMVARTAGGEREIEAGDFFFAAMDTALEDAECLTEILFPVWQAARVGTGFQEVSIRDSDFAIVAAAVQLATDENGKCTRAAVTVGGCAPAALKIDAASDALVGSELSDEALHDAAALIADELDPDSDVHATADYRRRVAGRIVLRALHEARTELGA